MNQLHNFQIRTVSMRKNKSCPAPSLAKGSPVVLYRQSHSNRHQVCDSLGCLGHYCDLIAFCCIYWQCSNCSNKSGLTGLFKGK